MSFLPDTLRPIPEAEPLCIDEVIYMFFTNICEYVNITMLHL